MRSTKSIILIVIALACGLIASIGISQVMARPEASAGPDTETIYVAASNLPNWKPLTAEMVKEEEWPAGKVPPDAVRSLEELEGKSPKYPLYPGEPIVMSKLTDENSEHPSVRIPAGHQVFAVKVDKESALSGLISPGDKVDVLVFIRGRGGSDKIATGTKTILRNTTVFAVNDQIERQDDESSIDAKTVSLLVRPDQSEKLLLAKQLGTIHLALRKPGDETAIDTKGAKPDDLNQSDENDDEFASNTGGEGESSGGATTATSGIFDILNDLKQNSSTAVDSSTTGNALAADAPGTTSMVIMSPDGVLNTFTFSDANAEEGSLPALPQELMGGFGAEDSESDSFGDEEADEPEISEEDLDSVDPEGEAEIDLSDLGL